MKRMVAFIFGILSLVGLKFYVKNDFDFENFSTLTIVTQQEIFSFEAVNFVENGSDKYYTFSASVGEEILQELPEAKALIFTFDTFDINAFISMTNGNISKGQKVGDYVVYEGYNESFKKFVFSDGKKINFQLAKREKDWVLGLPIIMTGF